ncbi:hypothetical protein I317_05516 [Kwoniella heveanensis CBS 569]|uniref:Uncharacterized protein n=1 Tax=Kwoniella heveanensis BCC8398 TaxID=1296120 RepID=A0A1B9GTE5_9TREE|nr:hypothetical protein I316_03853 [Kwoniella heveanensis BCC8398]OCF40667.1 hypothetical protein I317_05516 [Kwoniella heveanensis CBS 569]
MDPLLLAHPPTTYAQMSSTPDDEMAFDAYCIVCDRLIVAPKEVESPEVKQPQPKKKFAGGTIRVKNPDGTTTTRSANGQKVTRPALKRNPNSAARIAAMNATSKMQPLTRSKTNDAAVPSHLESAKSDETSPKLTRIVTQPPETPFRSSIYCSKACMDQDAGKSSEAYSNIARTLSYDFSQGFALETPGVAVHDHRSPYGPPSPLFVSGSDTESSAASNLGLQDNSGPASSAPKFMEYFRLSKEGPDQAWQEVQRQRRSSMQPAASRPVTQASTDSLSSLWNGDSDYLFDRSVSGSGKMRAMTPFHIPDRESLGHGRRSVSISSEHSAPMAARQPLRRSELSQSSLAGSPSALPIPAEFGSAPSHTLDLLQSYANAFPVRSPSGLSTSCQRGFVFPGSTAMSPNPSEQQRRSSMSRPVSGTIRAKSRTEAATWDNFGKHEIDEKNARSSLRRATQDPAAPMSVPAQCRPELHMPDNTPKQSLEKAVGGWKIKYFAPSSSLVERSGTIRDRSRSTSRSSRASSESTSSHRDASQGGIAIPSASAQLSTSSSTATSRTPLTSRMPPPASIPARPATSALPDIGSLRLETGGCAIEHAHTQSSMPATSTSVPRTGFNWESSEKKGMRTYELPDAPKFKLDRNKAGLFYFQ